MWRVRALSTAVDTRLSMYTTWGAVKRKSVRESRVPEFAEVLAAEKEDRSEY